MTLLGQIAEILEAGARRARELDAEARAERRDWVDQAASPLGRRRHVTAVRRRTAAGDAGAAMVGRRALLSAAALEQELAALSARPKKAEPEATGPDALRRRLGLVGGSR